MQFVDMRLNEPILRAVRTAGYAQATPIQAEAIPPALSGRDVIGCAQTGTGKTAAFALPVLHRLAETSQPRPSGNAADAPGRARKDGHRGDGRRPRCLVLCPTRELAVQITESFDIYGRHLPLQHATVYGGVGQGPQVRALRRGVDVLIATPGRLLDLIQQGHCSLGNVQTLVLDEADRMLDMGFMPDIKRIIAMLKSREQTLLFSATMPAPIRHLADSLMHEPVKVHVAPETTTADNIEQSVYFVDKADKPEVLADLLKSLPVERGLVFTRTRHGADRVVRNLRRGGTAAEAIHGDKSQNARQRALKLFRDGRVAVLVATDVASRGLDIDGITHVINYDVTHEPESYVHRIGRTARAGAGGAALSLCDGEEVGHLRAIQRLIGTDIRIASDHRLCKPAPSPASKKNGSRPSGGGKSARQRGKQPPRPRAPHPTAGKSGAGYRGGKRRGGGRPTAAGTRN